MESENLQDYIKNMPERLDPSNKDTLVVLKRIALTPETPSEVLAILADCDCPEMLEIIAAHPNCAAILVDQLSKHSSPEIRMAAGESKNCNETTLMALVLDESADVRYSLAENHNIPTSVLERLVEDENPYVAHRAQRTLARLQQNGVTGKLLRWLGFKSANNRERFENLP